MKKRASILVALLWCVVLLSLVVISVLHTARMDLMVVKNYGDKIQARYLALAGIEKAKALLYQNAKERTRSGRNHSGEFYNTPEQFHDITFGRGQFSVLRRARQDEGGGIVYGVGDEESRLNINTATIESLMRLNGMTPEIAASIMDWRDGDNTVSPGGAESEYYLAFPQPYQTRNGPFQSIRELLMVKGVSSDLLFGKDTHANGLLNSAEDEESSSRGDTVASDVDTGWAALLTVDSNVSRVNAAGQDRVDIQNADETALAGVHGITKDIASAIVSYRGQNQFKSIADLLDVKRQSNNQNRSQGNSSGNANQNQNNPFQSTSSGPTLIDENLLLDIADDVTVGSGDQSGAVNINTASLSVLACLPGVTNELAQSIVSFRQSSGFFPNIAYLLRVPGMTRDIFKQIGPLVSARSETYRILSEGRITSTGARQRVEMIVHIGLNSIKTLSYREDDL
jgi:competence ComEA-like helix-hairpin-helix protein